MSCSPLCPSHGLCWLRQGMPEQWLWVPGRFRGIVCRPGGGVAPEVGGRAGMSTAGLGAPAPQQPGPPGQAEAANSLCPRSWARAPRRACGCAARTCCCRCLRAQVSLRRFSAAFPACLRPFCLSSPTCHLGLARCPCRKGTLRFSGWSLEQEAGLPRHASLCCPWGGGTQSCPFGLQGLRGRALGGEVLSPGEHPCWKPRKRPFSRGACMPLP